MTEQHQHEAVIYYNGSHAIDQEILAHAENYFDRIRKIDLSAEKLTDTRLQQICMQLELPLAGLVRSRLKTPEGEINPPDFGNDEDRMKFLLENPAFIRGPIVITKSKAAMVAHVFELYDLVKNGDKILI